MHRSPSQRSNTTKTSPTIPSAYIFLSQNNIFTSFHTLALCFFTSRYVVHPWFPLSTVLQFNILLLSFLYVCTNCRYVVDIRAFYDGHGHKFGLIIFILSCHCVYVHTVCLNTVYTWTRILWRTIYLNVKRDVYSFRGIVWHCIYQLEMELKRRLAEQ